MADMLPSERAVLPPSMAIFSRTITVAPLSTAVAAATMPAPPAPTTITSALVLKSAAAALSAPAFGAVRNLSDAPAFLRVSATAFLMASELIVAPPTASTAAVWAESMAAGSSLTARSPMPGVSECFTISIFSILSAETVTRTVTSALRPWAVAS